jgi:hypothetical protein
VSGGIPFNVVALHDTHDSGTPAGASLARNEVRNAPPGGSPKAAGAVHAADAPAAHAAAEAVRAAVHVGDGAANPLPLVVERIRA